jgi:Holliday junction DNA helicase RuvB
MPEPSNIFLGISGLLDQVVGNRVLLTSYKQHYFLLGDRDGIDACTQRGPKGVLVLEVMHLLLHVISSDGNATNEEARLFRSALSSLNSDRNFFFNQPEQDHLVAKRMNQLYAQLGYGAPYKKPAVLISAEEHDAVNGTTYAVGVRSCLLAIAKGAAEANGAPSDKKKEVLRLVEAVLQPNRIVQHVTKEDVAPPVQLIGPSLIEIVGQRSAIEKLKATCEFFSNRGEAVEHFLITGPEGMGKRTIARAVATELKVPIKELDAATLDRKSDLTAVLTVLEDREVLLIHNIGSMRLEIRQILLRALQDYIVILIIGRGPSSREHPFRLRHFTCIATINRELDCPLDLREAFALNVPIETYSNPELISLVNPITAKLGVKLDLGAAQLVASACGGVPHQLEVLVKRLIRIGGMYITAANAREILSVLGIKPSASRPENVAGNLQHLTGTQFESLITALLARKGFQAKMTKSSGDGGIDIVAVLDEPLVGGTYLVQCKRFSLDTPVGAPLVRDFYGAISADRTVTKGIMVTTSRFTDEALTFANRVGIELIDGQTLNRLLGQDGMSEPSELRGITSAPIKRPKLF